MQSNNKIFKKNQKELALFTWEIKRKQSIDVYLTNNYIKSNLMSFCFHISFLQMKMDLALALLEWELEQTQALKNWEYLSKQ